MTSVIERIETYKLVPVIKLNHAKDASPLACALEEGGLPVAEITFRTNAAEQAIKNIKRDYPDVLLGAGTVTTVDQVQRALEAGARFIVSPGVSDSVITFCLKEGVDVFAGVCTPTEMISAMDYGLTRVKFFPAAQFGGLRTIKALSAPFPGIKFMPTGGVTEQNVLEYLSFQNVFACGGSWMVPEKYIDSGSFTDIKLLVARAVELVSQK